MWFYFLFQKLETSCPLYFVIYRGMGWVVSHAFRIINRGAVAGGHMGDAPREAGMNLEIVYRPK